MRDVLTASATAASLQDERAELLELILRDGILHRSSTQPVLSRDGTSARWMLDSLSVSMNQRGAELSGRCLLALLEKFEGRQLATYGLTGVPLMQSAILQSRGHYHGLIVRKEKKAHGSLRRIEGQIDPDEPTILVDDSISSGLSMEEGANFLREAGLWVEGGVALVRFGWENGFAALQEQGLHMEAVYDVWEDLMSRMKGEETISHNPTKRFSRFPWSEKRAPEGLHPAMLARIAMEEYFRSGKLPRPPRRLDEQYDSRGGVWVSVRDKNEIYYRHARDGFWNFPGEAAQRTPEAVLRAAFQTANELGPGKKALAILDNSHIAVTFFSALEKCTPGKLDNERYGIVVCSRERPSQMGGALPRMPGISNEWEQFRHAWRKNAALFSFEPYTLYRHDVQKAVEPGVQWQPSGVPANADRGWHKDPAIGGSLAERARDIALAKVLGVKEKQSPLTADLLPRELHSLYITVYCDGKVRGCAGSAIQNLDGDLRALVESALHDHRFAENAAPDPEDVAVTASLLFNALELGELTPEEVCPRFELGKQALAVRQSERQGMLLPFLAATHNLDREEFVAEVIDKAGITRPPYRWERFDCVTWLADDHGTNLLECGFRRPSAEFHFENELRQLTDWHASYILRNVRPDGSLYFSYAPFQNWIYPGGGTPRSAHAAWVLMRAADLLRRDDLRKGAEKLLEFHLKLLRKHKQDLWIEAADDEPSVSELSFTLLALCEQCRSGKEGRTARAIVSLLWCRIDRHGRIATHRNPEAGSDEFQDYFPGQLLLALAGAVSAGISVADGEKLRKALRFYRHRYRYKRNFGQVSWLMQAARRWHQVTGDREWADLAFEIGDWIRTFQLEKHGGFITDHQADGPGYTTALYLEGLAAGVTLARQCGDDQREQAYLESCGNGLRFLRNLIYRPEHDTVLPNPAYALGGVRASPTSSAIRTDFVQHSLAAILDLRSYLGIGGDLPAGRTRSRARFHTTTNGFKPGGR